ncbi:BCS1-like protein 2 [Elsinoe fawcettii]|nr:BCS1-like protein 2 [Elsinoe fawcettii]
MDIVKIGAHLARTVGSGNVTTNGTLNQLPTTVVEAVIPGYSVFSQFVKMHFGFDISIVVTVLAVLLGLNKTFSWAWNHIYGSFEIYCMSKVYIEEDDDLFDMVFKWLSAQKMTKKTRMIKACTQYGSAWDDDSDDDDVSMPSVGDGGHFNFGKWQSQIPPRFEPYYGHHRFWFKGRYFSFQRTQKPNQTMTRWGSETQDLLEIRCIGFTTQPIKTFLQELKIWHSEQKESRTIIRNASTKNSRFGMGWSSSHSRPSRPIGTVILDDRQKEMIVDDMDEFLHPESPKWYASRGIPYRRGYLFYGPPGTGKTSLSFALAGIFGLDIYCCALNDPELTEGDLRELFNALPRRCIVLLEDIDEAGIKRADDKPGIEGSVVPTTDPTTAPSATNKRRDSKMEDDLSLSRTVSQSSSISTSSSATDASSLSTASSTADPTTPKQGPALPALPALPAPAPAEPLTATSLAEALIAASRAAAMPVAQNKKRRRGGRRKDPFAPPSSSGGEENGISLSGLLNAIDGVATHEGRVLIMTTNHPEALDDALVRTGRVDVKVCFDFASRAQVKELYGRMYSGDFEDPVEEEEERQGGAKGEKRRRVKRWFDGLDLFEHGGGQGEKQRELTGKEKRDRLEEVAREFAEKVPEKVFSPSDVQGFLLLHKKTPLKALREVEGWVERELEKKREKKAGTA